MSRLYILWKAPCKRSLGQVLKEEWPCFCLLFKFLKNLFFIVEKNWLKCCVSFRCTAKIFSYIYTCIYSFSIFFPFMLHRIICRVACANSWSLLDIDFKYKSEYMSMSDSEFITATYLSSLVTIGLFSKSMSLSLFCK